MRNLTGDTYPAWSRWFLLVIPGILFIAKNIVIFWSVNKGMDLTDEGYYMLLWKFPEKYASPLQEFHTLLNQFFGWIEISVVNGRLLRIFMEWSGVLLFVAGLHSQLRTRNPEIKISFAALFLFTSLGAFMSLFSRSISYNDFTSFHILSSAGLILWAGSFLKREIIAPAAFLVLIAGFFSALQFFNKFSSAVLFIPTALIACWFAAPQTSWKIRLLIQIVFLGGMAMGAWMFLQNFPSVAAWWDRFSEGISVSEKLGYEPGFIITQIYLPDLFRTAAHIVPALVISALLFRFLKSHTWPLTGGIATFMLMAFLLNRPEYEYLIYKPLPSFLIMGSHLFIYCNLYFLMTHLMQWKADRNSGLLLSMPTFLWLFSLPWIMMNGTDTVFTVSQYAHLHVWFALLFIWFTAIRQSQEKKIGIVPALIILISAVQFNGFYVWAPYRLPEPLFAQQSLLSVSGEELFTDRPTHQFIEETGKILQKNEFKKGDAILAVKDLPGLVYLLGGYSPGTPWYFGKTEWAGYDCHYIGSGAREESDRPWFIILEAGTAPEILTCLRTSVEGSGSTLLSVSEVPSFYDKKPAALLVKIP